MTLSSNQLTYCSYCNSQKPSTLIFSKDGYDIVECNTCELVYVGNPPSDQELADFYSFKQGYHTEMENIAANVAKLNRAKDQYDFFKTIADHGRVLDVGCSAGLFLNQLKLNHWEDIHGLELSSDTAAIAKSQFNLDVTVGTLQTAKFEGKKFDVITLWDVIEHVKNPLPSLKSACELLNPEGILIIETPNVDGLFPKLSRIVAKALNYWPHPEPPGHLFQFSEKTMAGMLKSAGFRVEKVQHKSIPLNYSFGEPTSLMKMPKRLIYALVFAPFAFLGPFINQGDTIRLVAKKI